MTLAASFDAIDVEHLRRIGGLKWSTFPDAVGAFVAEMDFGVAPGISRAVHAAVDQGLFGYLPSSVSDEMSQAAAEWMRDVYGWVVPASDIHPIADVIQGLKLAIEHFSRPGAPVIVPTPAYMPFLTVPIAAGREVIQVPMIVTEGRYRLDLDGIDAAFRAGADLLVLCNPYTPVGRVFDRDELVAVGDVFAPRGGRPPPGPPRGAAGRPAPGGGRAATSSRATAGACSPTRSMRRSCTRRERTRRTPRSRWSPQGTP